MLIKKFANTIFIQVYTRCYGDVEVQIKISQRIFYKAFPAFSFFPRNTKLSLKAAQIMSSGKTRKDSNTALNFRSR